MKTKTRLAKAGLGLAAGAVAAYLLSGERGEKNREKLADWAENMREDIKRKTARIRMMNKEIYFRIVDETALRYSRMERVGAEELRHLTEELKGAWVHLFKQLK